MNKVIESIGGKVTTIAEYDGSEAAKPVSYIYTGELPECKKPEAKQILENTLERLLKKLEAERLHGSPENAEYLEKITRETEATINEMQTDR